MRGWLFLVACLGVIVSAAKPPNIIFILADDFGYGDLQTYPNINENHAKIQTPHLTSMAEQGTRWTQVYAGDAVCAPSRCSLMTGLHSGHSRIRGNKGVPLEAEDVTIPMLLKKANYSTGMIGKWGLGLNGTTGQPNLKGFDTAFGYYNQDAAHDYYPSSLWNNFNKERLIGNDKHLFTNYTHDLFTNLSLSWISEHANQPNPFFLYLAFTIPHAGGKGTRTQTGEPVPDPGPYEFEKWPTVEIDFASMLTRLDASVGSIFSLLSNLGIDEDTIVFFASDNGAHEEGGHSYLYFNSSGPLQGCKRSLFDGGIRVPMIVRWPGVVPANRTDDSSVWAFWDVMPTLADAAGIPESELPSNLDGVSKLPTILGQSQDPSKYLYWEFCCNQNFRQAVRLGDWKGIKWSLSSTLQLYNLTADIGEQNDLASQNPTVVASILDIMQSAHVEDPKFPSDPCLPGC